MKKIQPSIHEEDRIKDISLASLFPSTACKMKGRTIEIFFPREKVHLSCQCSRNTKINSLIVEYIHIQSYIQNKSMFIKGRWTALAILRRDKLIAYTLNSCLCLQPCLINILWKLCRLKSNKLVNMMKNNMKISKII